MLRQQRLGKVSEDAVFFLCTQTSNSQSTICQIKFRLLRFILGRCMPQAKDAEYNQEGVGPCKPVAGSGNGNRHLLQV